MEDRRHTRRRVQQGPGLVDGEMLGQSRYSGTFTTRGEPKCPVGALMTMERQREEAQTAGFRKISRKSL